MKYARWYTAYAYALMCCLGVAGGGQKADGTIVTAEEILRELETSIYNQTP